MRGMMRLALLGVPGAQGGGEIPVSWILRADFVGPDLAAGEVPAELGEPYVQGGLLTTVQADGSISIEEGHMKLYAQTTPAHGDLGIVSKESFARTAGLALFMTREVIEGALSSQFCSWTTESEVPTTYNSRDLKAGIYVTASGVIVPILSAPWNTSLQTGICEENTAYRGASVLLNDGSLMFIRGGEYTTWRLLWVDFTGNDTPLYVEGGNYSKDSTISGMGIRQLPAPFTDAALLTSVNEAAPGSGTPYAATAGAIHDLTVTAPNPLSGSAALRYRVTDADNYWTAYLNDAGAFRADSVAAGTPTNRVNVAGVMAAGQTCTLRAVCDGTKHNYYTLAGTNWTKRGGEITLSHQDTATAIVPEATDYTLDALRSYPTTSPAYAELDRT